MSYSVGQVAALAHVTVRALHHYDEIGLLSPSDRSPAGYRLYNDADLERLQQILTFLPEDYDQEVRERWKDTSEFEESQRRVSQYTKEDWTRMKAAAEENGRALVEAMKDGVAPQSDRAMALAELHREHISQWFYECSYEIHRGLGEMYVADPRFTAFYDRMSPGLATYLRDAIVANAARNAR